jgi:hypothetical protein
VASQKGQNEANPQPTNQQGIHAEVRIINLPQKDGYDKAQVWINLALAAVGSVGVVVGICTLVYLRKQAAEMRLQRKAMIGSLAAMKRQSVIMEDTAKRQLRAYMCYRQGRIFVESDGSTRAQFELENTGQTPAYGLHGFGAAGFGAKAPKLDDAKRPPVSSLAVVGAGKSFKANVPILGWRPDTIQALSAGTVTLFVLGQFRYQDTFNEVERAITFQIGLGGKFGKPLMETKDGESFYSLMTDSEGNDAT